LIYDRVYAKIEAIEQDETSKKFRFQFQALNLVSTKCRMGMRIEPTTVLEIARYQHSPSLQSWVTVFRSRPVYHSNSPCWDLAEVALASLCGNDDLSKTVKLSIYRIRSRNKQQKFVGMCETTIDQILKSGMTHRNTDDGEAQSKNDFRLQVNYEKLEQVGSLRVKVAFLVTESGRHFACPVSPTSQIMPLALPTTPASSYSPYPLGRTESTESWTTSRGDDPFNVDLKQLTMRLHPTQSVTSTSLSDFIDGGGQLDFVVAIDFTSSNGKCLIALTDGSALQNSLVTGHLVQLPNIRQPSPTRNLALSNAK
jgi:hypothetical protein